MSTETYRVYVLAIGGLIIGLLIGIGMALSRIEILLKPSPPVAQVTGTGSPSGPQTEETKT
jgi:hypothetical protein